MIELQTRTHTVTTASRMIYVDDDIDALRFVRAILETNGLAVETFTSALAAIQSCNDTQPNLILLDVNMPEMSGPEILAAIRGHGVYAPAIFLTSESARAELRRLDASVIHKPFTPDILLAEIDRLTARASSAAPA